MAVSAQRNALVIRLEDACWSRILTELKASGVFSGSLAELGGLLDAIAAATISPIPQIWRLSQQTGGMQRLLQPGLQGLGPQPSLREPPWRRSASSRFSR